MNNEVLSKVLDVRCRQWKSMIDNNCHIEVRKSICRYFSLSYAGKSIEEAYNELQRANSSGVPTLYTQRFIDVIMLDILELEWGDNVRKIVERCLLFNP